MNSFSIANILRKSSLDYRTNFTVLAAVFLIPALIVEYVEWGLVASGGDPESAMRNASSVGNLLYMLSTGCVFTVLAARADNLKLTFAQASQGGLQAWWKMFVISFFVGVNVLFRGLLILPAVAVLVAVSLTGQVELIMPLTFVLLPIALIPALKYSLETSFAMPILFAEGLESRQAIEQSRSRTSGLLWPILGIYLLAGLAVIGTLLALGIAMIPVFAFASMSGTGIEPMVTALFTAVIAPIGTVLIWNTYEEAKQDPRFS